LIFAQTCGASEREEPRRRLRQVGELERGGSRELLQLVEDLAALFDRAGQGIETDPGLLERRRRLQPERGNRRQAGADTDSAGLQRRLPPMLESAPDAPRENRSPNDRPAFSPSASGTVPMAWRSSPASSPCSFLAKPRADGMMVTYAVPTSVATYAPDHRPIAGRK
jgi:hypothetical protein